MIREIRLFFTALAFFTRIPCTRWTEYDESGLNHAVRYFPLVGVLVGGVAALVWWLASWIFPQEIAVIASMVVTLWLTGALHEDGLADTLDGLGGGGEKEQALAIMQDSRLGSYGALTLVMALLVKFEALLHIPFALLPAVFVAGHALSRLGAVLVIFTQTYVRATGKAKALAHRLSTGELLAAALWGAAPLLLLPVGLLGALLPVALVWMWFSLKLHRRLGGYTGDCLGAMQQLCELAFYLGVLACSSF